MRDTVRLTSAADISSLSLSEEPTSELDLLLRLSGRIVKGCRTAGQLSRPPEDDAERGTMGRAGQSAPATLTRVTGSSRLDFEALYRGQAPGPGLPPVASPPWDTKTPKESVVAWQAEGLIRGNVLDAGERASYAAAAYRAARPGASLLVCCFSETESAGPRW